MSSESGKTSADLRGHLSQPSGGADIRSGSPTPSMSLNMASGSSSNASPGHGSSKRPSSTSGRTRGASLSKSATSPRSSVTISSEDTSSLSKSATFNSRTSPTKQRPDAIAEEPNGYMNVAAAMGTTVAGSHHHESGTTPTREKRSQSTSGRDRAAALLSVPSADAANASSSSPAHHSPAAIGSGKIHPASSPSSPAPSHGSGSAKLHFHHSASSSSTATSTSDTVSLYQALSDASKLRFSITSSVPVHSATEKEFTAFLVTIISPDDDSSEHRTILRRYRQFAALHASVAKCYPEADLPHFPKKRLIGNMSQQLVEKRRRKLEIYLQHVARLPNIEDLLGFVTFLGGDLSQRGNAGSKKKAGSVSGATGSSSSSGGTSLGSSGGFGEIDESYRETEKEKEQRVAAERRYNEVKYFVGRLDSCIYKLEAVEMAFEHVYETIDFVVHSEYSKLVVILGKYLGSRPLSADFVPRELSKEKEDAISNVKIRSIRQKIIPAISELVSKLRDIKESLLDVTYPMDKVLELTHIIDDVQDIFDESNLVPKSLGFRIEAGATHYEAMRERWLDYIETNVYHYKAHFVGNDHVVAYNGERTEGAICVALKPEKLEDTHGEFRMFVCSRDGNDCTTTKVHFTRLQSEWRERFAEILTAADNRLRGIEWTTCTPAEAENFLLEHEKRDMRITRRLKFGVLLCLKDQEKEEEMFGNFTSTPAFDFFLEGMGTKTVLSGYTGFAGGLDTRGTNSTGEHSYTANWQGLASSGPFQLMYHVSTMLPHGEADQNLAKKRHIGNDIVAIVFQEDGSKPFMATTIKSNYLQIIIVVRAINLGDRWAWRVTVSNTQDVPEYGPPLPYPPIFTDRTELCQWLIHKMVNGELAAYRGKLFVQQFRTTWKTLVADLVSKMPAKQKKGSSKSATKEKDKKDPKKK